MTAELQLRNVMGLPWKDDRRILPTTKATEALVDPDWEKSHAVMLENQPDVVRSRAPVKEAEADRSGDGLALLERRKESLRQNIHQTTHSMARFFLGIDANFKQFKKASQLREAAANRLEAQKTNFQDGRITIDRLLDAVSQWASAVATEAQYKSTYNTSIVALEEAKGTLLDYKQISVVAGPNASGPATVARDRALARTSHEPPSLVSLPAPPGPAPPTPIQVGEPTAIRTEDASPLAAEGAKTVTFQFTVGIGSNPIEIRGSFTVTPAPSKAR